ncbi:GvpL/GvpF family gas vesicle protein [Streptomyces sp. WMMC500]|uniref:GvpL/GvpF family gas vesicle protein n=1 Tax=Streptomyces sp. WMMC500 TaxID=3015154 RepID=UPI00248C5A51|nr:GvpL/GvpF family gas vesicle protein [Streptomyces sp. WMMC500]WBB62514.1 GvpL/GvpF family gas vesicle protein [Streptomyces sp. WMMC500]
MASSSLYVYAVVNAGLALPPGLRGVGRPPAPVRLLPAGELAAVVSDVPPDLRARRRDLTGHQDLLLTLCAVAPVLPMRFGMVAEGAGAVRRALDAAASVHLATLRRLDGRTEMNLKAMPAQGGVDALVRDDAAVRRLAVDVRGQPSYEGNVRLGSAIAEALSRRAAHAAEHVAQELVGLADECVRGTDVPGCVLNTSFLLPHTDADRCRELVDRRAAELRDRVEFRLTGPLPCYSFVPREGGRAAGGAARRPAAVRS